MFYDVDGQLITVTLVVLDVNPCLMVMEELERFQFPADFFVCLFVCVGPRDYKLIL